MRYYRPTWAEIDLGNLAANFKQVKRMLPPNVRIMACVKADAYGHGLIPVAKRLASCGVDYLSVASIDEGIKLRQAKVKLPVLVLGSVLTEDIAPLFKYNIHQTVCSLELAVALNKMARARNKKLSVHIKVDTGMGRLGVLRQDAARFVKYIRSLKYLNIEGIFTHLACADSNPGFTAYQINTFEDLIKDLKGAGINIPFVHAANSAGLAGYQQGHFNMVRPGLILYGLSPQKGFKIPLKPVLSLKTKIVYVKKVPKGWGISYGHTYVTSRDAYIATLPIGYGDGYPRNLSNQASVLIRGRRFKISGRVCMDQIMVDTGKLNIRIKEEAVLIGRQAKERITAEELARLSGTIPYEIVCGLGSRVPRIYID